MYDCSDPMFLPESVFTADSLVHCRRMFPRSHGIACRFHRLARIINAWWMLSSCSFCATAIQAADFNDHAISRTPRRHTRTHTHTRTHAHTPRLLSPLLLLTASCCPFSVLVVACACDPCFLLLRGGLCGTFWHHALQHTHTHTHTPKHTLSHGGCT